jgi:hypothetical protein
MEVLTGRVETDEACRRDGLSAEELDRWQQRFVEGAIQALESPNALNGQDRLHELHAKIGAQAM